MQYRIHTPTKALYNTGCIYCVKDSRDDKCYVGATNDFYKVMKELNSKTARNEELQVKLNKGGVGSMRVEILEQWKAGRSYKKPTSELNTLKRYYIDKIDPSLLMNEVEFKVQDPMNKLKSKVAKPIKRHEESLSNTSGY